MIGFQIHHRPRQVSDKLIRAFFDIPVANVSDCMMRITSGGPRLRPMHKSGRLAGPALTVKTRPGDNLMIHKALDMAAPGDIIVVDAGGDLTNSLFGEIMLNYAITRKIGGIVLNGAIRDAKDIAASSLPVYAAGVTHRGPYKDGPGEINVPIAIDGMVIHPGDLIIGDFDGFLCIKIDDADQVLQAALEKLKQEQITMANIAAGVHDTSWVDARLKSLGCDPMPQ
jgi:regulator of RNase E activity RraA